MCTAWALTSACQGPDVHPVSGTMDAPCGEEAAPARVTEAFALAQRLHQYEIMSDEANSISVEAVDEADDTPTEGYGIAVVKGAVSTLLLHISNKRQPRARYDAGSGTLWLATSAAEGSGIQVERLRRICFDSNGRARVTATLDPYDVQQALLSRLGYSIRGEEITLYDGTQPVATAVNTMSEMGGFDEEQPVWIGEQIAYDLSGPTPQVLVTPGVKYTVGLVLTYDDMPTLSAPINQAPDGTLTVGVLKAR